MTNELTACDHIGTERRVEGRWNADNVMVCDDCGDETGEAIDRELELAALERQSERASR